MDTTALTNPLSRFLEADRAMTRDRLLAKKIRPLQRQVAGIFTTQGEEFLKRFGRLRDEFSEAVTTADWLPLWTAVAKSTNAPFTETLDAAILDALILGGGELFKAIQTDAGELGISWDLKNPRAVSYAQQHAAAQVVRINDTTRSYLNAMITQAADEGWSYDRLSRAIGDRFTEFATGGKNPRSRRVAVYELGDAYEAGNAMAAEEMEAAGVEMEKKWLTVGDDRVRPSHRESQAEGWQPLDHVFTSGEDRPPTDPGCRCVTLYRRKK